MNRHLLPLLVLSAVLVAAVATPVAAAEDPRFLTTVAEPRLTPGADQAVTIQLVNDAKEPDDRVKTATDVQVEALAGDTPFEVLSGVQRLGTMPDGTALPVPVRLSVPADAAAGTYRLPLRVTYEFDGDTRKTKTVYATLTVPTHPVFVVRNVSSTVSLRERGTVTVTMRNEGSATAHDASLTVQTSSPALAVEGAQSTAAYAGKWAPGDDRTFTFDVTATPSASVREYALTITTNYDTDAGIARTATPNTIGVTPSPRQTFAVGDVTVTHHSGTDSTLNATVTNTGDRPVENAFVTLSSSSPTVVPTDPTVPVGSLAPGASATVSVDLRTAPSATSGPRGFTAVVQYDRADGSTYRTDPIPFSHPIATGAEVLAFEPVNNTFALDDTNRFVVRVTNVGTEPLTDVHARIGVVPPYQSAIPTAYVASLAPGESALLAFEVTTPSDSVATRDAVPIVANATAPGDRSIVVGPTLVPFEIAPASSATSNTTNLIVGVVVVAVVLAAGWWWLNR